MLTIKFYTKSGERSVSGTIFAKDSIRIVDFFGYKLDFEPTPYVVAVQNIDKPGIIGLIGTLFGVITSYSIHYTKLYDLGKSTETLRPAHDNGV